MEEKLHQFNNFDWTDERWQSYYSGLYPQPNHKQVVKFKKKWFKANIDSEFDVSYEPPSTSGPTSFSPENSGGGGGSSSTTQSTSSGGNSSNSSGGYASGGYSTPYGDGRAWSSMGMKAAPCALNYLGSLVVFGAAVFGVVDARIAVVVSVGAFITELLMKHGIRFSKEYIQTVFQEDCATMCFLGIAVVTPGINKSIGVVTLIPFFVTVLLSFSLLCKHHPGTPGVIKGLLSPLAETSTRYLLMQARANAEVMLGVVLVVGVFTKLTTPVPPLLYWNIMRMRYATSPWTQASFRKVDGVLNPVLGRIPGVSTIYTKLKDALHNFAAAESQTGRGCTIL